MTAEQLEQTNFVYVPVLCSERMPDMMVFVPCVDERGEISVYRRTEYGWNMRDAMGDNSPNNNIPIVSWLEKRPIFADELVASLKNLLELRESSINELFDRVKTVIE
jgi:hypothetical protein